MFAWGVLRYRPKRHVASILQKACCNTSQPVAGARDGGDAAVVEVLGKKYTIDDMTNVTPNILGRVGVSLHLTAGHPVNIMKQRVVNHFHKTFVSRTGNAVFSHFDNISPVVTTEQNFDSLLIPPDHVARSKSDNYYINGQTVLRAHTSAHQRDFIKAGLDRFLVTGDVYRRDEIDSSHYPVFHQMEGVRIFSREELFGPTDDPSLQLFEKDSSLMVETRDKQATHTLDAVRVVELDLKRSLEVLMRELFGSDIKTRWNPCYFPFTHPSYELEIKFQGEWLEMLGSGVMRQPIIENGGVSDKIGWAFGLGLDRLTMLLFQIPDIRLMWSKDPRFMSQFESVGLDRESNIEFQPYSKYPACYKDITFWLPEGYEKNDFFDLVRSVGGDLVENVKLIDEFSRDGRQSHCYKINYRSMDRSLTNDEINSLQWDVRSQAVEKLGVELR